MNARFQKLVEKNGCKLIKVISRVDGKLTTRPDIMAVRKHGKYLLTVPARIYALRSPMNRDLAKLPLMNYFECEFRLKQELYKKLYA